MNKHTGLNSPALIRFMCDESTAGWAGQPVVLIGEGPWEHSDMLSFLDVLGVEYCGPEDEHNESSPVILGEEGWIEESVLAYIRSRDKRTLDIYTQDLFLAGAIFGDDSLVAEEALPAIASSHSGIRLLIKHDLLNWRLPDLVAKAETQHQEKMEALLKKLQEDASRRAASIDEKLAQRSHLPPDPRKLRTASPALAAIVGSARKTADEFYEQVKTYIDERGLEVVNPDDENDPLVHPDEALSAVVGFNPLSYYEVWDSVKSHLKK